MAVTDWLIIEGEYRGTKRPLRDIAGDHDITEGAIRARAKKNGWVRDAIGLVRQKVNDHIAGAAQNTTQDYVRKIMDDSARAGIADMEMGLSNSRRVLGCVAQMLEDFEDNANPRDLKTLNEANAGAIETIRRIRQLDEPQLTHQQVGIKVVYTD